MKTSPLVALYATILLATSVVAWADGCLTATAAWQTPGGGKCTDVVDPDDDCMVPNCYGDEPASCAATTCASSKCNPGYCSEPTVDAYCTGGASPWTQQIWTVIDEPLSCSSVDDSACVYGDLEPNYICAGTSTNNSPPPCYTTWYNGSCH